MHRIVIQSRIAAHKERSPKRKSIRPFDPVIRQRQLSHTHTPTTNTTWLLPKTRTGKGEANVVGACIHIVVSNAVRDSESCRRRLIKLTGRGSWPQYEMGVVNVRVLLFCDGHVVLLIGRVGDSVCDVVRESDGALLSFAGHLLRTTKDWKSNHRWIFWMSQIEIVKSLYIRL